MHYIILSIFWSQKLVISCIVVHPRDVHYTIPMAWFAIRSQSIAYTLHIHAYIYSTYETKMLLDGKQSIRNRRFLTSDCFSGGGERIAYLLVQQLFASRLWSEIADLKTLRLTGCVELYTCTTQLLIYTQKFKNSVCMNSMKCLSHATNCCLAST